MLRMMMWRVYSVTPREQAMRVCAVRCAGSNVFRVLCCAAAGEAPGFCSDKLLRKTGRRRAAFARALTRRAGARPPATNGKPNRTPAGWLPHAHDPQKRRCVTSSSEPRKLLNNLGGSDWPID